MEEILRKTLPNFEVRDGQIQMLSKVQEAFENHQITLIEAGTGTGKSIAYLIPALLWACEKQETVVISTHTISLQEQLLKKDLPLLIKSLDLELPVALLKGMSHYACIRRCKTSEDPNILSWIDKTATGSKSEFSFPASYDQWDLLCADIETCTSFACPHLKQCFFFNARNQAHGSRILIVNHHLLLTDLAIRHEMNLFDEPCLLPPYQRVIIDEAHHLEEVATATFARKVSSFDFFHHFNRLCGEKGGKLTQLDKKICEATSGNEREGRLQECFDQIRVFLPHERVSLMDKLQKLFLFFEKTMGSAGAEEKLRIDTCALQASFWQEEILPALKEMLEHWMRWTVSVEGLEARVSEVKATAEKLGSIWPEISGICKKLRASLQDLEKFCHLPIGESEIRWMERERRFLTLTSASLDVSSFLKKTLFEKFSTVILCSATLTVKNAFDFYKKSVGIDACKEAIFPSPFNYQNCVLLGVPTDLPDPDHPSFLDEAALFIKKTLSITLGGTFILFTSHQMMKSVHERLQKFLEEKGISIFLQGKESRHSLLEKFKATKSGALFGTDSFWEGVDVAGEALKCVILVKLPFKAPNDPIAQGKSERIAKDGKSSPFFQYFLPSAVVKFKQGFGRLIRTAEDKGVVLCLDKRLLKKPYGKLFLKSLPQCMTEYNCQEKVLEQIKEFFKS